jgi:spermidine/putrescine transport system substrate-binding protein
MPDRPGPNRRRFLQSAALLAVGTPALAALLDACSKDTKTNLEPSFKIATPDKPVLWDISADNMPIANGLSPEKEATLHLYSYDDYISPEAVKSFEDAYGANVWVSTFNDTEEALSKIKAGNVDYDIYTPSYDQIGRLVTGGFMRPLNHSYIPNIENLWPIFSDPWYDREWRYSVPYTVYSTGIGWRTDLISADIGALENPYAALWDPAFKNETAVIDDYRTVMAMVLLKLGMTDVNTSSADDLKRVSDSLADMKTKTSPAVSGSVDSDLSAGQIGLAQMWSGSILSAKDSLPTGVNADILRYWFPASGRGLVDNDLMVAMRGGRSPVLAHLFLNHMLDPAVAKENFSAIGYQPPQVSIRPDSLVAEGFIPKSLAAAIVRPEYFDDGYRILELDSANADAWRKIWREFKTGRS